MTELLIVPRDSLARAPEDLDPLVQEIKRTHNLSVELRPPPPHRGYAVYLLSKGLDAVVGHAYELLINDIKEKVTSWYRERRAKKGDKRPFSLTFRDGSGRLRCNPLVRLRTSRKKRESQSNHLLPRRTMLYRHPKSPNTT